MTKPHKVTVAALFIFSALMPIGTLAQVAPHYVRPRNPDETPAPKVVFIGDQFTYNWGTTPGAFPSNWLNQGWMSPPLATGESCYMTCEGGTSESTADRFQADVVDLHPNIVHIMVGSDDADSDDAPSVPFIYPNFLSSLETMVNQAKAANIQVILGLESTLWPAEGQPHMSALNSLVASYGAENNIPVINYGDALCACVGSAGGSGAGQNFITNAQYQAPAVIAGASTPTPAGYALMTQMATAAIATLSTVVKSGYLQNVAAEPENGYKGTDVNTVLPGTNVLFTPVGLYSDGTYQSITSTTSPGRVVLGHQAIRW